MAVEKENAYTVTMAGKYNKGRRLKRSKGNLIRVSNMMKCKKKAYIEPQPIAENLLQNKAISILGAELARAKPKAQKHKEMQKPKKTLFKGALGLREIIYIPKNKEARKTIKNNIENNIEPDIIRQSSEKILIRLEYYAIPLNGIIIL